MQLRCLMTLQLLTVTSVHREEHSASKVVLHGAKGQAVQHWVLSDAVVGNACFDGWVSAQCFFGCVRWSSNADGASSVCIVRCDVQHAQTGGAERRGARRTGRSDAAHTGGAPVKVLLGSFCCGQTCSLRWKSRGGGSEHREAVAALLAVRMLRGRTASFCHGGQSPVRLGAATVVPLRKQRWPWRFAFFLPLFFVFIRYENSK